MVYIIIAILLIIIIYGATRKPRTKGEEGEKIVRYRLSALPQEKYIVLNDILLPADTNMGTSQIDHIVVSIYGIFVIETKNYQGWIFGGEQGEYWKKSIYGKKFEFKNPILQNYGHIKALKALLNNYPNISIKSIIVFSDGCDLKINCPNTPVMHFSEVKDFILEASQEEILKIDVINEIAEKIKIANVTDKNVMREHIKNIKITKEERDNKINNGICPRCGGKLIEKEGKYGKFVGCSNYPNCKFKLK